MSDLHSLWIVLKVLIAAWLLVYVWGFIRSAWLVYKDPNYESRREALLREREERREILRWIKTGHR